MLDLIQIAAELIKGSVSADGGREMEVERTACRVRAQTGRGDPVSFLAVG